MCVPVRPYIPLAEDWLMVAPLTGNEPDLTGWLWRQNAEHRIPLPKIIYLFLLKITHGDFRAGMVFNVLSVGFLSAAFILVFKYIVSARKLIFLKNPCLFFTIDQQGEKKMSCFYPQRSFFSGFRS